MRRANKRPQRLKTQHAHTRTQAKEKRKESKGRKRRLRKDEERQREMEEVGGDGTMRGSIEREIEIPFLCSVPG